MTIDQLRAKYPYLRNYDDAEIYAMVGDGELDIELEDPEEEKKNSDEGDTSLDGLNGKDSLGNNASEYSDIGPRQGSVLPAGDQGNGATTTPVEFNDAGIETTTFDGSGAQVGDTTTSTGTGSGSGSGDSGGSWLGAVIGGIKGYQAGRNNYETDSAMTSGEDGYGKYHHDARAEVGGGIGGAYLGYLGASPISEGAVEWSHPIMQDATRSVINTGDDAGGAYGAMVADPIGSMASGKYSWEQIKDSGDMFSSDPGTMGGEGVKFGDKVGGTYGSFLMNPIATVKSDDFEWKNLFKLFKDGGKVRGPGTGTSDSVTIHASNGEGVLNAEVVSMIGTAALDKLNAEGLRVRDGEKQSVVAKSGIIRALKERKGK